MGDREANMTKGVWNRKKAPAPSDSFELSTVWKSKMAARYIACAQTSCLFHLLHTECSKGYPILSNSFPQLVITYYLYNPACYREAKLSQLEKRSPERYNLTHMPAWNTFLYDICSERPLPKTQSYVKISESNSMISCNLVPRAFLPALPSAEKSPGNEGGSADLSSRPQSHLVKSGRWSPGTRTRGLWRHRIRVD